MIDEEELARLVRRAVQEIEVPTDGPERILAARDATAGSGQAGYHRFLRRPGQGASGVGSPRPQRWLLAAGAAVMVLVLASVAAVGVFGSSTPGTPGRAASTAAGPASGRPSTEKSGRAPSHKSAPAAAPAGGAVGSNGAASHAEPASGSAMGSASAGPAVGATPAARAPNSAGAPSAGAAPAAGSSGSPAGTLPNLPSKVIKTGSMSLVVGDGQLTAALDRLSGIAAGLGGYVQDSSTNEGSTSPPATTPTTAVPPSVSRASAPSSAAVAKPPGQVPTATATLRVPVEQFNALVTQAQQVGKVTALGTTGADVTSQYVDLQARIQALQATRSQLLQVLAKAETISDILAVQAQITPVESQIEQLQGQLKVLDDQTSYGTLGVTLSEMVPAAVKHTSPPPPPRPSGLSRSWTHARHSFSHGLESVVSASGGIGVFLLCSLVVLLVANLGWRLLRRRLV